MIGIIGFGRFGKLTAGYLAEDFDVFVFNRTDKSTEIKKTGARKASLKTVCQQKIVILCVPISTFKEVLVEIGPLLKRDVLVVDAILATHPIFGPDSASDSLKDQKIFLSPIRIGKKQYQKIKTYLASKELVLIESTPEDHDEQIAISLALTHFIGRTLSEYGAARLGIDSEGYKRLLHILEVVEHDTWQLFYDMHRYNPYAKEKRAAFMQAMQKINEQIEG
jgi:prephenate dehydrogenase